MNDPIELDPGAAFRAFDPDPRSDVLAYRWTYFRPARPKLVRALAAVSGLDEPVVRDWLAGNDAGYVIEAMSLDVVLDSVEEAWESLIANDVVPDNAAFPEAWSEFATTAGDLALMASDWSNVMAAQSLAREALRCAQAWQRQPIATSSAALRWSAVDDWSTSSVFPARFAKEFSPERWYYDDADEVGFDDRESAAIAVALRSAMTDAHSGWSRNALSSACLRETLAANNVARYREAPPSDPRPRVELARTMPDLTHPLRAIRRLGYALLECVAAPHEGAALTLGAPSFRWPAR